MPRSENGHRIPLDIVVIGGGTGNSTVLEGLKPWAGDGLTAVVNTFDDGGGAGKIRQEYGNIAVGDLRQCARAMSDLSPRALKILEGRYGPGSGLSNMNVHGQTVGNLILEKALQEYAGDPDGIIDAYSEIYQIRGKVLPVSHDSRQLWVTTKDGVTIKGEHEIEETPIPSLMGAEISFDKETSISEQAEAAISEADLVVLAPGDIYTSIGPNLAVRGMKEALRKATAVVQVANLMNRNRHTVGFSAIDYATEYDRIIGERMIDRVLYNNGRLDGAALKYQAKVYGSHPVEADHAALESAGYRPFGKDLLSHQEVKLDANDAIANTRSTIRHDADKVAHALMGIYFGNGWAAKS